jgi:peptide-methionine (R)-S-oxide reductase
MEERVSVKKISKSEEEWKSILSPDQFFILRQKGTEQPHSGKLLKNKKTGEYTCAACGLSLFKSGTKFDSGTGWPSFADAIEGHIEFKEDRKWFMKRVEVVCARCGGHLGHVFNDGPAPTGKRYCVNSAALGFKEKKLKKKS